MVNYLFFIFSLEFEKLELIIRSSYDKSAEETFF